MGSTISTFDGLMKERYGDASTVEKLVYPENTLLAMLEKKGDTGMVGELLKQPLITGNPQGISGGFGTAQTNATNLRTFAFDISAGDYFGAIHIGDKVMMASRTNAGAFLTNKTAEIDGLYEQVGENLSIYLWGNGGQALGQISTVSATQVQLVQPSTIANFEIGMVLRASANDGSDAAHQLRSGVEPVTAIARSSNTLTAAAWSDISAASGDYLFREGDFFGDQGVVVIKGVQAFITATNAPPALWGISANTRATDPERFAGCRVLSTDLEGKTQEERIKILLSRMTGTYKAKRPTAGFMHPEDFVVLDTLMNARGQRALGKEDSTSFGFAKIDVVTPAGTIPIYNDRHCPRGTFFALRMEDWAIHSMGELVHPQNEDGLQMLRRASSTDYEFRLISYPLLSCRAPKNSGRVPLS